MIYCLGVMNFLSFSTCLDGFRELKRDRALAQATGTLMFFGFFLGLFFPSAWSFCQEAMAFPIPLSITAFLLMFGGAVIGGFLSCRVSDQKVELGIVPLGSIVLVTSSLFLVGGVDEALPVLAVFCFFGVGGGLFVVPLSRFLRYRASDATRIGVVLMTRLAAAVAFLVGMEAFMALRAAFHFPAHVFLLLAGAGFVFFTAYLAYALPYPFLRFCVWCLTHSAYRLRVVNNVVIPPSSGALIVANHLSFVDVLFLIVSTSRRVRFVTAREIYNKRWLKAACRIAGAFPISPKDSPKEIARTLASVREAIQSGEVVCLFPEGQVSRTGNTLRFGRGIEYIMRGLKEPIIPAYLDRVWGSMWSFDGGRLLFKLPRVLPHPITVVFGEPMPSFTKTFDIRQAVLELGAGVFRYRLEDKMTLPELFFNDMRHDPFSLCMADSSGRKLNRFETIVSSYALAQKLKVAVKEDRFVGVFLPPSVGGAVVNIALSILGKVAVNLNYTSSKEALAHAVKECGMRSCLTSRLMLEKLQVQSPAAPIFVDELAKEIKLKDRLLALLVVGCPSRALAHRLIFGSWKNRDNNELATVVFTSGSTGIPKGVMLTHRNIASNLEALSQIFHIRSGDGIMGVLPFFHSFGYTATLWFPFIGGMFVAYHNNPLDAQVVGEMTRRFRPTLLIATPTFLSSYTRRCEIEDLTSLLYVVVGAEKLKSAIGRAFEERFGIAPLEGYGCTELSPIVSVNLPDYQERDVLQKAQKRGTIGLPIPGLATRIVDSETFRTLGPGEEGLLLVKGASVMKGYLNQPKLTADVIIGGWYKTGDIAFLDEDGFITITDRLSRFSKIAGEMIPHMRVEEAIHTELNASELMCAVASVPDEKRGERLVVLYTLDFDVPLMLEKLKRAGLPNLWIPEAKMFFKVDAIPLLGSGKLDLASIKLLALKLTGQS